MSVTRTEPEDVELLSWADVVRFIRRNLWTILGASLGLASLTVLILGLLRPPEYEAVATLVLTPQRFRSQLKPPILPVQGYQRLLESNAVVAETAKRLRDQGVLKEGRSLRIGHELMTRIFVSQRAEETTLAPVIELVAEASTPEAAAAIATTWSEVFLERAARIQEDNVAPMLSVIEGKYQEERRSLLDLMAEETRLADEYGARIDALSLAWERKLVEAKKHTQDLIAEHNAETRRLAEEFAVAAGLRLADESAPAADGEVSSGAADEEVERRLLQILSLRTQLAQTSRFLVLEKAISNDALWQAVALSESQPFELGQALEWRLATQEANPVYDQLTLQLSEIETDLGALSPEDGRRIHRFTAGLEQLQAERTSGLTKLLSDRTLVENDLERQRTSEIQALQRERKMKLDQADADVSYQRALFKKLAENRNEAGLAEAEQNLQDIRLGAPAVPPAAPKPRRLLFMGLVAAFAGGLLGLVIALVREVEPEEVSSEARNAYK